MKVPDGELQLLWLAERDPDAFAEIVSRHGGMVFGACRRLLKNATDAEEITQECFVKLAQWGKQIRPSLGGWLYTVATRKAMDRLRSDSRRTRREERFQAVANEAHETDWDDIREQIDEALMELPSKNRSAVVYRFLEGRTYEECAELMGVSQSTAQYRVSRGVEQLRKGFRRRGVIVSAAVIGHLLWNNTAEALPATLQSGLGAVALVGGGGVSGAAASATSSLTSFLASIGWVKALAGVGTVALILTGVRVTSVQEPGEAALLPDLGSSVAANTGEVPGADPIAMAQATEEDAEAAERPITDAREIIAAFQATLASQLRSGFVFTFTDTTHYSLRAASPQTRNLRPEGDGTYYRAGELGSDGHRVAFSRKRWGQVVPNRPPQSRADSGYESIKYDGKERWAFTLEPRSMRAEVPWPAGKVMITRGRSSKDFADIVGHTSPTHWLQGYLSKRGDRVDTLMHNAKTLTLRKAREKVGNSVCDVVDFSSPYGRGTLWFDPARGHLLAQAEIHLPPGHFLPNGQRVVEGSWARYSLRDVSFRKVDGVWFATSATVVAELRDPEFRLVQTSQPRITNIVATRDMDALGLFSRDDIKEGAKVSYIGHPFTHEWRGGRLVPMNNRRR